MIDAMFQDGIDKTLNDQVQRPRPVQPQAPGLFAGFGTSAPRGIGAAGAEMIAFGAEITGAFGQVAGAYGDSSQGMFSTPTAEERKQQEQARNKVLHEGVDYSNEAGDLFRSRAKDIMPDPNTTGAAGNITAGLTNFIGKAAGYTFMGGPMAPMMLGGDAGLTESDKLKQQGVDLETRTKAAAVQGAVAGASIVLPVVGSTAAKTAALVGAAGPGGFVAQNVGERLILENAGYKQIADQYDPLDPVGLALSTLVPAAFGFGAYRVGRGQPAKPAGVLNTEAQVKAEVQLTPQEQARSDRYERSEGNLAELQAAVLAEKNPESRSLLEAELGKQRREHEVNKLTDQAIQADPDLVPAARVGQVAEAMDEARLTSDADLAGRDAHQSALELASDQLGRGERVDVANLFADHPLDPARVRHVADDYSHMFADMVPKFEVPAESQGSIRFDEDGRPEIRTNSIRLTDAHPTTRIEAVGEELTRFAIRSPEGEVLGYTDLLLKDGQVVSLYDIETTKGLRGKGVGAKVIEAITSLDPDRRLDISNIVDEAVPFWEKVGVLVSDGNRSPTLDWHQFAESHAGRSRGAPRRGEGLAQDFVPHDAAADHGNGPAALAETRELTAEEAAQFGFPEPEAAKTAAPDAALGLAAAEVVKLDPDLLVQLDGMDGPVRVGDLLEAVKREAAGEIADSKLVEVAAQCALR